ncbi:MAG: ribonuclease J [bacterium]
MNDSDKKELKIIPLGRLGEVGLNMMVFEQNSDIMVVDCGLMFPGDYLPGVDYVLPDFTYLLQNREKVRGIVLTHGHEDHIGALPFFLSDLNVPIYGTPLTIGMVREKLVEHDLADVVELNRVQAGETVRLGSFEIDTIRVSHSIADCLALAIKADMGTIIHTGDFKLDPTPIDGKSTDLAAFARHGDQGVLALLSDSTNVERSGYTLSEREVGKALYEVIGASPGRVIVSMFASNIHRIQQVVDVAYMCGRKVAVMGRSMIANCEIAQELGYLNLPRQTMTGLDELSRMPDQKAVLLTTGTQGEPLSVLSRMARDEHKQVSIREGDTVVLSSRFIPGNETAIHTLINEFYRRGAEVIYEKVSDVHVSGHASREELKLMLSLTRPAYFMPVHGEYRHLVKHAELARQMGIPEERILNVEDGDVVTFDEIGGERVGSVETGRQVVDGVCVADFEDAVLSERRRLCRDGVLIAVAGVEKETGKFQGPVKLESHGFLFQEESEKVLEDARLHVEEQIKTLLNPNFLSREEAKTKLRAILKKHIKKTLQRFPVIIPVVVETENEG